MWDVGIPLVYVHVYIQSNADTDTVHVCTCTYARTPVFFLGYVLMWLVMCVRSECSLKISLCDCSTLLDVRYKMWYVGLSYNRPASPGGDKLCQVYGVMKWRAHTSRKIPTRQYIYRIKGTIIGTLFNAPIMNLPTVVIHLERTTYISILDKMTHPNVSIVYRFLCSYSIDVHRALGLLLPWACAA